MITANESISCSLWLLVERLHPVLHTSQFKPNCFLEHAQWQHFVSLPCAIWKWLGYMIKKKALDSKSDLKFNFLVFKWDHSLSLSLTICFELHKHKKYVNHGGGKIYHLQFCNYGQTIPSSCMQKCNLDDLKYISFNLFYCINVEHMFITLRSQR